MLAIVVAVGMLGHNAHHSQRVQQCIKRLVEMELHNGIRHSLGTLYARKISLRIFADTNGIYRKGNIGSGKRLAIAETNVIANLEGPYQMIRGTLIGYS